MKSGTGSYEAFHRFLSGTVGTAVSYRGRAFLLLAPIAGQKRFLESIPESRESQHSLLTLLGCISAFLVKGHMERSREDFCEMLSSQLQDLVVILQFKAEVS